MSVRHNGNTPLGNEVKVQTTIPAAMFDALEGVVAATGVSKSSLLRHAVAEYLERLDALPHPEIFKRALQFTSTFVPINRR